MSTEIAIIEIPQEKALDVFTAEKGLDPYLNLIAEQARSLVPDLTTKKGRDAIASNAYKVRQSKTAMDKAGKALVDKLKEQPKLVDAERKRMREFMDALADEVRGPLDEFEEKEAARVAALKEKVEHLVDMREVHDEANSEQIKASLDCVSSIEIDESYEEFEAEAHREKARTIEALQISYERRKAHEEEQAELARLRAEAAEREQKEREERIAKEAAERAQREAEERAAKAKAEAEAKAKAEQEAAERREIELKLAAEKAEREKLEAEERAKNAAAETEARLKREAEDRAAAEKAAAAKREANKKHQAKINNEALTGLLTSGITEAQGKEIIKLIATKQVPHIAITY